MKTAMYFDIEELVCPHIHERLGEKAWMMFDVRLLETIDWIRQRLNKPIYVNSWDSGGKLSQRGLRCMNCSIVTDAYKAGKLYISAHQTGQALDFDVEGLIAEEVRQWLIKNQSKLPHAIRLESVVSWVHIDLWNPGPQKVITFNP